MDQKFVKRNYLYIVYDFLKKNSGKHIKHFTAEDLINEISKKYGVVPNRKTIYTVIDDLKTLGFDIKTQKDFPNRGYYLDHRQVKQADFSLILDGIGSLKNLSVDWKQDIIENLSQALGYDYLKINMYEYDSRYLELGPSVYGNDEYITADGKTIAQNPRVIFEIITDSISEGKQLILNTCGYQDLGRYLLEQPTRKFKEMIKENQTNKFVINPYQIFRNKDNLLCLLYYINYKGETFVFANSIFVFWYLEKTNDKKDRPDKKVRDINLDNFSNASSYRQLLSDNNKIPIQFTITYGLYDDSELFQIVTSYLDGYTFKIENGIKYVKGYYKRKDEDILRKIAIENGKYLVICPPCQLYYELSYIAESLNRYLDAKGEK